MAVSNLTLDADLGSLTNLTLVSASVAEPGGKTMYSLSGFTPGMVLKKSQLANLQLGFTPVAGFVGTETATFTLVTDEGAALGAAGRTASFPLTVRVTDVAYWKGTNGGAWNTTSPSSNWTTAADGLTPVPGLPEGATDVYFSASGAGNTTTTLGQDFSIRSLNYTASTAAVTIGGSNTLALSSGVTLASNSASQTISANVGLAATQTWSINAPAMLTVSGQISGSGSLVKDGSGALVLSGTNTYLGGTVVDAGVLRLTSSDAVPNGSSLSIGSGATLIFHGAAEPVAPSNAMAVPEPSTLALLVVAGLALAALSGKSFGVGRWSPS
jgi:autotransporter-associated beta strand protein